MLRGCFLALDLLDPIGHRFRRGKYVVQGGAVIRGGLVLVVLNHMMNTAEKGFPCGRFILLHISILLREVYIRYEIDRGIAGLPIGISCGECQGVPVKIVQHIPHHERGPKLVKTNHRLLGVTVKRVLVICDTVDINLS